MKFIGFWSHSSISQPKIVSSLPPEAVGGSVDLSNFICETIKRAKGKPKDYVIVTSLCGRGEKDLSQIQKFRGKDFEW